MTRKRRQARKAASAPPLLDVASVEGPPPPQAREPADERGVGDRIRELEERIDKMIDETARRSSPALPRTPPSTRPPREDDAGDGAMMETAKELFSSDFYLRKWGRLGMRNRR
jgi:hypothetical protein